MCTFTKKVFGIMIDDIMPTDKINILQKRHQFMLVRRMIHRTIPPYGSNIMYFIIL